MKRSYQPDDIGVILLGKEAIYAIDVVDIADIMCCVLWRPSCFKQCITRT